ncbi:DUF4190 domain-containing protein [Actinomycetospora soli]|uniref:DUF4190 domain-containing protein n=1 Tax=Actinomycetospora soli TaxID=2893887 RepID=UPI001E3ABC43|nr:DUF4190 domain-containing protein [Actinomycetospora soli]MCD2188853.1 DUF4190 domain-containing protein [Actinomycetospora soli]
MTEPFPQGQWDAGTATPPPKPKNGMGTAALVFGILGLLTCWWLPIIGFLFGLLAVIFGVIGRGRVRKQQATNGGVALTGLLLGLLSVIVNIILMIVVGVGLFAFFQSGGGNSLDQLQQCLAQAQSAGNPAAVQQALAQCQEQFQSQLPNLGGGGQ